MNFQVISSGSKGNLTIINTNEQTILIDAGISLKDMQSRIDYEINNIDAIFITHEHVDHIKYIESIARNYDAVIYINEDSFNKIKLKYFKDLAGLKFRFIKPNEQIKINTLKILPINLQHDVECCYGYIIVENNKAMAYCTDTGFIPLPYIEMLKKVDSIIIEANHDVEMLLHSNRPWLLKNRILSVKGHMSNKICGEIINKILEGNRLKTIVLAHLSEECNTEELAVDTVLENLTYENIPEIYVAKQKEALSIIEV